MEPVELPGPPLTLTPPAPIPGRASRAAWSSAALALKGMSVAVRTTAAPVAVAVAERVRVPAPTAVIVVLAGMPAPVTVLPPANWPVLVIRPVISVEPLVVLPVPVAPVFSFAVKVSLLVAVALAERVRVPAPTAVIVVLEGMPVPVIASPTWKAPRVLETSVTALEPLVLLPEPVAVVGRSEKAPLVAWTVMRCCSLAPVLSGPLEVTSPPNMRMKLPSESNFWTRRLLMSTT